MPGAAPSAQIEMCEVVRREVSRRHLESAHLSPEAGRRLHLASRTALGTRCGRLGVVRSSSDDQYRVLRERLVEHLEGSGLIRSARVAEAFRAVPRHLFVPEIEAERCYSDEALVTKADADGRPLSSSSQPAIMAVMLEQLALEPGLRVLEIGAGTGYNAALIACAVGDHGTVVTVDIDGDLVERARRHLVDAGVSRVEVVHADGALGWPQGAPYDRIILTVGAADIAPAWTEQLSACGRIVLPLSLRGAQRSVALERADGHLESVSVRACGFMRLRGALAGVERVLALGPEPGLLLAVEHERPLDADALYAALAQPGDDLATGVRVSLADVWGGLGLWLALHEGDLGRLAALGPNIERELVPRLFAFPGQVSTGVLVAERALAALVRLHPPDDSGDSFELGVRPLGVGADEPSRRLVAHVRAWNDHGRPSSDYLRLRIHPPNAGDVKTGDALIDTEYARIAVEWASAR